MSVTHRVGSGCRFLASGLRLAASLYGIYVGVRWLRQGPTSVARCW